MCIRDSHSSNLQAAPTTNPDPPTSPQAGTPITTTKIPITWTAGTGATSYQVQHCAHHATTCQADGTGSDWSSSTQSTTTDVTSGVSTTISSLTQGTTYNFRVRSVKSSTPNALSTWTTPVQATTLIAKPTGLSVTQGSNDTSLSASWTAVTGATGYKVRVCAQGCTQDSNWETSSSTTSTSYTITGLQAGTSYQVQVNASNGTVTSGWTASQTQQPPNTPLSLIHI